MSLKSSVDISRPLVSCIRINTDKPVTGAQPRQTGTRLCHQEVRVSHAAILVREAGPSAPGTSPQSTSTSKAHSWETVPDCWEAHDDSPGPDILLSGDVERDPGPVALNSAGKACEWRLNFKTAPKSDSGEETTEVMVSTPTAVPIAIPAVPTATLPITFRLTPNQPQVLKNHDLHELYTLRAERAFYVTNMRDRDPRITPADKMQHN